MAVMGLLSISSAYAEHAEAQPGPAPRVKPTFIKYLIQCGYSEAEIHELVVAKRTLARRSAAKEPLTVEETDKALRLARIAALAERVFGEREKARRWLRKPKRQLADETPIAYLASESGARIVEEMLHRIDHGIAA
jgi:putative toxin-antitoxin system antitoxin component (TIGR02293 family)